MKIPEDARLLVVDVQKDFLPGGALAVTGGDEVVGPINRMIEAFGSKVIFTKDTHLPAHGSFASTHGAELFSMGMLGGRPQVMWPDHCVVGTRGHDLAEGLVIYSNHSIVRKGLNPLVDSYSGFKDDDGCSTALKGILQAGKVKTVVVCGLATDYCVKATVLDAKELGFKVILAVDACRGVCMNFDDVEKAYREMAAGPNGVVFAGVEAIVNPSGARILPDGGLYE